MSASMLKTSAPGPPAALISVCIIAANKQSLPAPAPRCSLDDRIREFVHADLHRPTGVVLHIQIWILQYLFIGGN